MTKAIIKVGAVRTGKKKRGHEGWVQWYPLLNGEVEIARVMVKSSPYADKAEGNRKMAERDAQFIADAINDQGADDGN